MYKSVIAQTLIAYRKNKNINQLALSQQMNKAQGIVSRYENAPDTQFQTWFDILKELGLKAHIKVETTDGETILEINK